MKNIDLSIYKESKVYFTVFDHLLKGININKDAFLIGNDIAPSSYRRSRKEEQNIGPLIIGKLSKKFGYKVVDNEVVDELEKRFNDIYHSVYYKIYDDAEKDMEYLDKMLSHNYIIFPIINLFKLFLQMNNNIDAKKNIEAGNELFLEIKKYKEFYVGALEEIYILLTIIFEEKAIDEAMSKNYENGMNYYALSSNLWRKKRYVEGLYFAKIGKEMFLKDCNYKRAFYINNNIMNCLASIGNYEECYELALQEKRALKSLDIKGYLEKSANHFLMISGIALGKYEEILEISENFNTVTITLFLAVLVCKYMIDKNEYEKYLADVDFDSLDDDFKNDIKNVDLFLKEKNKKYLSNLSWQVAINLTQVLKRMITQL